MGGFKKGWMKCRGYYGLRVVEGEMSVKGSNGSLWRSVPEEKLCSSCRGRSNQKIRLLQIELDLCSLSPSGQPKFLPENPVVGRFIIPITSKPIS